MRWLIPHNGIVYLIPILLGMGLVFGLVNGMVAEQLLRRWPAQPTQPDLQERDA
jgi:heptaprenyl diphosphate synthase